MINLSTIIHRQASFYLAPFSSALMIRDGARIRTAILDQPDLGRIQRHAAILQHESRNPHIANLLRMIKCRIRISHSGECSHIADILPDINVSEFIFPPLDLLMNVITIRASRPSIYFNHISPS